MGAETDINWADRTFNGWIGCTNISPACDNCYAAVATPSRTLGVVWGAGKPRYRTSAANWKLPLRWNSRPFEQCSDCGWRGEKHPTHNFCPRCDGEQLVPTRQRVFCASLSDWLDNEVPVEWLVDLLDLIRRTPNIDWLLLTKRIGIWEARLTVAHQHVVKTMGGGTAEHREHPMWALGMWIQDWLAGKAPANVWIGATICNQAEADRDVPKLLRVPAAVRFLSIEPILGPIDLTEHLWGRAKPCADCPKDADCSCGWSPRHAVPDEPAIHWVIPGGESGKNARPPHPQWFRDLRDQCADAGVAFLMKQWGEWEPREEWSDLHLRTSPRRFERQTAVMPDGSECPHDVVPQDVGAHRMAWVGKLVAGRTLDGKIHHEFPGEKAHVG